MRIAFVTTGTLADFGTTYRVLGLASRLKKMGVDAHILLPGWPVNRECFPQGYYRDVPVHFTETGPWSEMQSKRDLLKYLAPQVVHCIDVVKRSFLPAVAYCSGRPCRLLLDIDELLSQVYTFPRSWYALWAERAAVRWADEFVVASRFLQKHFGAMGARRMLYLPNAVELEMFDARRHGWESVRQQFGGRKIVTYLGSLYPRYEADLVFEGAAQLLQQRRDVVFLFIGTGPLREGLEARTRALGLEKHVHWCGFLPDEDVPKYLCASDALVLPIRDTWINQARCPGKVYHYIAAQVPVVTNRVGEVAEALGECAVFFQPGDSHDFCRALERLFAEPQAGCRPSRALAEQHSWEQRANAYLQFLESRPS